MSKIAMVGDSTSLLGFKPIGVDAFKLNDPNDIDELWPAVLAGDYAVIIMTEPIFEAAAHLLKEIETRPTPAVLAVPSTAGSTGAGRRYINKLMERAVGASIKGKGA